MLCTRSISTLCFLILVFVSLAACSETPAASTSSPPVSNPPGANVLPTIGTPPKAQSGYCANGGAIVFTQGEPLAARVNGQAIPLAVYERQVEQLQIPLIQQGIDPNSDQGKEALKGLREQALAQLIDDALVEQAAKTAKVSVSPNDINDRVQQIINDAGSQEKFDAYLKNNQLTLQDLCQQIRAFLFAEVMMTRVTQKLPTRVEQVHLAHILFAKKEDADAALQKLKSGTDFAVLAKQISQDEATRDNGGEMGWFPRDVLPPEMEQAAFALKTGEISGVLTTQLGLHIVKVLERDKARALSPELIQNQRLAAFQTFVADLRANAKIEKLVQE